MNETIETTRQFKPRFDDAGLIPAVVTSDVDGGVLMVGYMNAEALAQTFATGEVHFYSRSRKSLWRKGETSGQTLTLLEMTTDCDQDCLLVRVRVGGDGHVCHTGAQSCFYRAVSPDGKSLGATVSQPS